MEAKSCAQRTDETIEGSGFSIVVDASGDLLELTIAGRTTPENAYEIAAAVENLVAHHRKPLLVDARAIEGRLGTIETYYHVRRPRRPEMFQVKVAVVDLPENACYYTFHETTAANAGRPIRNFNTPEEARAWLRE